MPKSRKRKRTGTQAPAGSGDVNWGGAATSGGVPLKLILGVIAVLVVAGGGTWLGRPPRPAASLTRWPVPAATSWPAFKPRVTTARGI